MPSKQKRQIEFPATMLAALSLVQSGEAAPAVAARALEAVAPARDALTDADVILRLPFKPPTGAPEFTILRSHEVDAKDAPALAALVTVPGVRALAAAGGDNFKGTARRAAKISVADAPVEEFADLKDLIATLPSKTFMKNLKPPIKTTAQSNRVREEKRNVRVRAFLYAASRESDNDFHLIIGRDPNAGSEMYMNVEISGLPPANSNAFAKLKAARNAYKKYWGDRLPGTSYDFYTESPRPVVIDGSLFWDASHATGQKPGPQRLRDKIPTIWEIHPITRIKFLA